MPCCDVVKQVSWSYAIPLTKSHTNCVLHIPSKGNNGECGEAISPTPRCPASESEAGPSGDLGAASLSETSVYDALWEI